MEPYFNSVKHAIAFLKAHVNIIALDSVSSAISINYLLQPCAIHMMCQRAVAYLCNQGWYVSSQDAKPKKAKLVASNEVHLTHWHSSGVLTATYVDNTTIHVST